MILRILPGHCHDYTSLCTLVNFRFEEECWYAIIVCIMCDVSLVYHCFQLTVEAADRQKHQQLVYVVDHVLSLLNRRL